MANQSDYEKEVVKKAKQQIVVDLINADTKELIKKASQTENTTQPKEKT